ncbi:MBL fold metallo-hydrolase [Haliangium sp.]|uniref:MBL fold metallo-hydrolase n=1 Tax=Haliangium sp. TaxID=2663208 RepID=UPI003D0CC98E
MKRPLAVPDGEAPSLPPVATVAGVTFSVIRSADIASRAGFTVRGASLLEPTTTAVAAFVVEHPRGRFLIDAGTAQDIEAHLAETPLLSRVLSETTVRQPTVDALAQRGLAPGDITGIILTHSHWDHTSGLADLRGVPVWMTPEELAFARTDDMGVVFRQIEAAGPIELRELSFPDGAYGPFEASWDVFDDGSVVVVPMPGHTPGSVGVFLTDGSGKRALLIGDTAWAREGVEWPAEKPWLARRIADHDAAQVRAQLVMLHRLQRANPELVIVPVHDPRVLDGVAAL